MAIWDEARHARFHGKFANMGITRRSLHDKYAVRIAGVPHSGRLGEPRRSDVIHEDAGKLGQIHEARTGGYHAFVVGGKRLSDKPFKSQTEAAAALTEHARYLKRPTSTPTVDKGPQIDVAKILADHPRKDGEATFEYQSRVVDGLPPSVKHEILFRLRERYEPVDYIAEGMTRFRQEHGLPEPQVDLRDVRADLPKGGKVAKAFEGIEDHASDPRVQAAFDDFKRQNQEMWDFATKPKSEGGLGIKVDFTTGKDPYNSAVEQAEDLIKNHHISIESGLGGEHPLLTRQEYDRFRAVHDIFGHAGVGGGFDRHGEYQAWLAHMSMYTGQGRDAMSSEYHGVNSSMWAGKAAGTGKAVLLPSELIRSPFDEHGNLVRK